MKNIIYIFGCILILTSCSKKKDEAALPCATCNTPTPPAPAQSYLVTAKINGQSFNSDSIIDARISFNLLPGVRMFNLYSFAGNQGVFLNLSDTMVSKAEKLDTVSYSYTIQNSLFASFDYSQVTSTDTISDCDQLSGWIKITSQDTAANKISGSFEYNVIDTHTGINDTIRITQGVFTNVVYQVYY